MSYLADLTFQLHRAAKRLPPAVRRRHADYLASLQRRDGGFAGREGESDLYYSGFAVRGLAMLDALDRRRAERAARFFGEQLDRPLPLIDLLSLLFAAFSIGARTGLDLLADRDEAWRARIDAHLEKFRRPDGGYARTEEGSASSTYHTFLVAIAREMLGLPPVAIESMQRFILGRQREDGGFVEIAPMRRSGTNPTAAALASAKILRRQATTPAARPEDHEPANRTAAAPQTAHPGDAPNWRAATDFLVRMQTDEGGFRANTRIPIADLLSTYTSVQTLIDAGAADRFHPRSLDAYLDRLETETGGFRAAVWDDATDAEYTFYGLATRALLCAIESRASKGD